MNDLVNTFEKPSKQAASILAEPLSEAALRAALEDPQNLMTHEIARAMAEQNRAPFRYAARMTPDRTGYAIASYLAGEKLSVFIKPDTEQIGAFWEFDLKKGQFTPDPNVDKYLRGNYDLYLAAFQSVINMQDNDAGNIGWAATHYASYYSKTMSARIENTEVGRLEARP